MSYQLGKGIVPTFTDVGSGATLKGDSVNIPYGWWIHTWLATNAKGRCSVIWTLGYLTVGTGYIGAIEVLLKGF